MEIFSNITYSAAGEVRYHIFELPLFPPKEVPSGQLDSKVLLWLSQLDHMVFFIAYFFLSIFFSIFGLPFLRMSYSATNAPFDVCSLTSFNYD